MKGENRRVRLSFKLSSNQQNAKLNFFWPEKAISKSNFELHEKLYPTCRSCYTKWQKFRPDLDICYLQNNGKSQRKFLKC